MLRPIGEQKRSGLKRKEKFWIQGRREDAGVPKNCLRIRREDPCWLSQTSALIDCEAATVRLIIATENPHWWAYSTHIERPNPSLRTNWATQMFLEVWWLQTKDATVFKKIDGCETVMVGIYSTW